MHPSDIPRLQGFKALAICQPRNARNLQGARSDCDAQFLDVFFRTRSAQRANYCDRNEVLIQQSAFAGY